jgi:hypothetical protein
MSVYEQTKQGLSNVGDTVVDTTNNAVEYVQQTANNVAKNVNSNVNSTVNSTRDFFESNSIIARVTFLIMAIFVFVILLKISLFLMSYFMSMRSGTVRLINGMINGNEPYIFPQDPNRNSNARTLLKSNNAETGVEFTWTCWLYVNGITSTSLENTVYKHVFSKGNRNWNSASSNPKGVAYPNNAPGVYLSPTTNELSIFMNTYNTVNEEIIVNAIPLNKWFNLTICCVNKSIDVYINGIIVNSHKLISVPKQNYGDVYVCNNGGFIGNLSNLVYYNKAISLQTLHSIVSEGPNFKPVRGSKTTQRDYNYLSIDWYFNNPSY